MRDGVPRRGCSRYDIETVKQYRKWDADIAATDTGNGAMSLSLLKFVGQASLVDDAMLPS